MQPSTFIPLPPIHCFAMATDAMPDVLDDDSFAAALRWRRMPLWECLPPATAAFILARSCVDEPEAPSGHSAPTLQGNLKRAVRAKSDGMPDDDDPDEEMYGMHEDVTFAPNDDFQFQNLPESSERSLGGIGAQYGEVLEDGNRGHKRMRAGGVVAEDADITMSADENGSLGVLGARWSDHYTSDSGGKRGTCCGQLLCGQSLCD